MKKRSSFRTQSLCGFTLGVFSGKLTFCHMQKFKWAEWWGEKLKRRAYLLSLTLIHTHGFPPPPPKLLTWTPFSRCSHVVRRSWCGRDKGMHARYRLPRVQIGCRYVNFPWFNQFPWQQDMPGVFDLLWSFWWAQRRMYLWLFNPGTHRMCVSLSVKHTTERFPILQ